MEHDAQGLNVYHACSTYKTTDNRTQANVGHDRALWLDLDVGIGNTKYPDKKTAYQTYDTLRIELGLPPSWVIDSGSGVHIYQPFTNEVTGAVWKQMAAPFRACLDHAGVKHDSSRTEDTSSILRIPGTRNYKTDPAKNVAVKRVGVATSSQDIFDKLTSYLKSRNVVVKVKAARGRPKADKPTNDLIGIVDHTPSVGEIVAEHCPVIKEVQTPEAMCRTPSGGTPWALPSTLQNPMP